jgi:hypothetical protein
MKFDILVKGTLYEDLSACIISLSVLLTMRKVSKEISRENATTHFMFSNSLRKSCHL